MAIDEAAIESLRSTLAADDYHLAVAEQDTGVRVTITAGSQACDDCLVPKPLMRNILQGALGVAEQDITLIYPAEATSG